jgi:hypothetical protein
VRYGRKAGTSACEGVPKRSACGLKQICGSETNEAAIEEQPDMIKGAAIAAVALFIAVQIDQHYDGGFYADGALAMFRQIRYSFGW